ncbi:MAG: cytochrome C [Desulfuromonadales bacterium]
MANKSILSILTLLAALLLVAACTGLQSRSALPARHPSAAELTVSPKVCTDCHERGQELAYERYVHTADFGKNHRPEATQGEAVCAMCHQTSFCNDCHATRVELKPSLKNQSDTYRSTPHRGDYLSRHRIDGRVDPTSCFRCHGNPKAAQTCARCHG